MISLLFNMLSRFVIAFLPRSKCLLILWLQSPSAVILEHRLQWSKICHCFHFVPICLWWCDVTGCPGSFFLNIEFKPGFPLSSFTLIKRLFNSSSVSAIRVVSSAYLRLLILLPAILISACDSPAWHFSWSTLHVQQGSLACYTSWGWKESDTTEQLNNYNSAYKLNKQGDNIQPCPTPFPVLNQPLFHVWF